MRKQVILVLLFLLIGCAQQTASTSSIGYPNPGAPDVSPTQAIPTYVIPTPDEKNGVVVGQLVVPGSGRLLADLPVYFGQLLPMEPGPAYMVTVQEKSSPHTLSDGEGHFALSAKQGDYVLIIWTPIHSRVVINPATNKEWQVSVKAGETINIGKIEVEWP
jgi:hypothetical protein